MRLKMCYDKHPHGSIHGEGKPGYTIEDLRKLLKRGIKEALSPGRKDTYRELLALLEKEEKRK